MPRGIDYRLIGYMTPAAAPEYVEILLEDGRTSAAIRNVSDIGPFHEGTTVTLLCRSGGGRPAPRIEWWNGTQLLTGKRIPSLPSLYPPPSPPSSSLLPSFYHPVIPSLFGIVTLSPSHWCLYRCAFIVAVSIFGGVGGGWWVVGGVIESVFRLANWLVKWKLWLFHSDIYRHWFCCCCCCCCCCCVRTLRVGEEKGEGRGEERESKILIMNSIRSDWIPWEQLVCMIQSEGSTSSTSFSFNPSPPLLHLSHPAAPYLPHSKLQSKLTRERRCGSR